MRRIEAVRVTDVRFPTSDTLGGSDAMNPAPDYSASYVELQTSDAGLAGYGFTFTIGTGAEIVTSMVEMLGAELVGREASGFATLMPKWLEDLTQDSYLRWLGPEKGVTHLAAAAVLNALWDLWARSSGVPLWKLLADMEPDELVPCLAMRHLGDAITQDSAWTMLSERRSDYDSRLADLRQTGYPGYLTSAGWLGYSDAKLESLVREALADGWSAFKLKVGADLEDDLRRLRLVRRLIGDDAMLMADANQVWEVPEAISWIRALGEVDLYWIEEPTSPDDILGHKAIAEAVAPVRVATGEHGHNRIMFKQFLASKAMDVCQIDSCRLASVNENVAVLMLAEKFGVPVCPHAGGVGLCELVQHLSIFDYLRVSQSLDGRYIEYVDHLHEMFVEPVEVHSGRYFVPEAAGYSAQLTESALEAYAYPTGRFWVERLNSRT